MAKTPYFFKQMYNYSSVKEMIKEVEDTLESGQTIVDGWEENNYYVLEIASANSDKGIPVSWANFTIKLLMPQ